MATESGRTDPDLTAQLAREPYRFEFFQAVRLLERAALCAGDVSRNGPAVGEDNSPREEVARFRVIPSLAFPAGEIASVMPSGEPGQPAEVVVPIMGLTGPAGVLPLHYTQLLIERIRRKDVSLRDFLDTFHHRLISLFYRAWRKYRYLVGYERALETGRDDNDYFTYCLYCLVGLGTSGLRRRLDVDDRAFLFYSGHFAHAPRSATVLQVMVGDYLEVSTQVVQFVGQWLYLSEEDQSCTPSRSKRADCNNELGKNVVVGHRVWGMENRFRVRLGPLTYAQFNRFSPRGDLLRPTAQFIRSYVGGEFDFDIQPVLRAAEVPMCRLGGESFLGWNSWICSTAPREDVADAIFIHEGWANR